MAYRTFIVPRHIYSGPGALENLSTVSGRRAFIVTDAIIRKLGIVAQVEKILHANDIETQVFDEVEAEPSKETAWKVFALLQGFNPDIIVGLGGGSAMDVGKVAWVLYEHPDLADLPFAQFGQEFGSRVLRKKAHYIAITTSAGTGSEVTHAAVVIDRDVDPPYKAALNSEHIIPDVAIVDPELTVSMPSEVTANTGFDALIHAIECYVLIEPSDIVDSLALWSAKTIWEWLPRAVENGQNLEARDKMHNASLQAGMAFSNGRLGAVHAPAHDIGAKFHIPHGRANAFMLCPVFAWLYPTRKKRFGNLAAFLGFTGRGNRGKTENLLAGLDRLKQAVGIPLAIKDAGIDSDFFHAELDPIVDSYMERFGRGIAQLPLKGQRNIGLPASAEETKRLYIHAWNGTRADLK
ncbi:MAG: iron-containing alcohol dehydrogenase [Deltaproteobacteria bacterium]|nr:iron-containing alcohol dehydrogenase [Deltaproteobacteria bacterium]